MKQTIAKTRTVTACAEALGYLLAQQSEQIGIFQGVPGVGKTKAAEYVASIANGIYFVAYPGMSQFQLSKALLKRVSGLKARSFAEALDLLIEDLNLARRPLIIDEADFLVNNLNLLEILRSLHDLAHIPLILVGMQGLSGKLKYLPQFYSRIQYIYEAKPFSKVDARTLTDAICEVGVADDLLDDLFLQANSNPRLIKTALVNIESFAEIQGLEFVNKDSWGNRSFWHETVTDLAKSNRKRGVKV